MAKLPRVSISKEPVFHAKFFDVKKVEAITPSGTKHTHHIVQSHPTVCIFPLSDDYELYLISEYRYLFGNYTLGAIAGYIEEKESALLSAKRELQEEAGIIASQWEEIARVEQSRSVVRAQSHLFLARNLQFGKANPEDDEEITLVKMSLETAVRKIFSGEINHSVTMLGILMLDRLRIAKRL